MPHTALAVELREGEEAAATEAPGEAAAPATTRAAVPFDKRWLDPFFASGPARAGADLFRAGDFAAAAQKLAGALAAMPARAPERNQARFLLALAHMNLNAWQAAGDLFEDLWSSYPELGPYHAGYAARCRLRRGDAEAALAWVARVPGHTVPEAEAVLVKIDALIAKKRWSEVESEAKAFLDRFPSGPRRAEAKFRLAEAMQQLQRPAEEIATVLRRIWAEAPLEAWANRADENLQALAQSAGPEKRAALCTHSAEEWATRGMALYDKNQNPAAEAAFAAALTAPGLDAATDCVARFHRAQSVWKQRQRTRAAPLFAEAETACQRAQNRDLVVRALYQGARSLAGAGERDKALALYARIESEFPEHRFADDARLRAAEVLTDGGDNDGAEQRLRDLPDRYPKGDVASEALWRLASRSLARGRLGEGRKLARRGHSSFSARGDLLRRWPGSLLERSHIRKARRQGPGPASLHARDTRVSTLPLCAVCARANAPQLSPGARRPAARVATGAADGEKSNLRGTFAPSPSLPNRASCARSSWPAWA